MMPFPWRKGNFRIKASPCGVLLPAAPANTPCVSGEFALRKR
nr:MAG TPA: hypothetical protein [Caudoviricetes sp.]